MILISGGTFKMGAGDSGFVEERTGENVTVSSFCIDKYEVTNAQFAEFVKATKYVTVAERPLSKEQFPDLSDKERLPGSLVFQMPKPGVKQIQLLSWWHWTPGANWRHPFGSDSTIVGKENHPVVHIAYKDALAYAQWAGKSLPTEAQWEYAARGGLNGATYTWGNQYSAKKANTWQGIFPFFNTKTDGYVGTAKVGSFPANGYGLYDMTGNVWECGEVGAGGNGKLFINDQQVAEGRIKKTLPYRLALNETFDVGRDTGTPIVETYQVPFAFTGNLQKLTLNLK
ncbi:formylglycine-generating enzyme family protein [Aphanizomenon sp. UHCC 0183]|nr:formylglycine-generating enzyme family protein [Aphanizomenon sp. UHCC 0183]